MQMILDDFSSVDDCGPNVRVVVATLQASSAVVLRFMVMLLFGEVM